MGNSEYSHYIMRFTEFYCKIITPSCEVLLGQCGNDDAFFFFPEHPDGVIGIGVLGTPSAKG